MVLIPSIAREFTDGYVTSYMNTVGLTPVTYTFNDTQDHLKLYNNGSDTITFSVGTYSNVSLGRGKVWEEDVSFNSITLQANSSSQEFHILAKKFMLNDFTSTNNSISSINAKLAEKAQQSDVDTINQIDYVAELQKLSKAKKVMNIKMVTGSNNAFNVNTQLNNNKILTYEFAQNADDDYIIALGGYIGVGSTAEFITGLQNYDSVTGTYIQTSAPNYYTQTVNDSLTVKVTNAEKVSYYSFTDNRGGIWTFTLDGGSSITISTYATTSGYVEQTLFDNLDPNISHTITGVFKGDDPAHVPSGGAGTSRGWVYFGGTRTQDTDRTFHIYSTTFDGSKDIQALYSYSNKDFAMEVRQSGTTETYDFVPDHNTIGTAFKVDAPQILVDGLPISAWKNGSFITDIETVQLIQHVYGYNPSDMNTPLMEIFTYQTIKDGVLSVSGRIKFLVDTDVQVGYTMMFPYWLPFATKLKTSMGNTYDLTITDGSHTNLTNDALAKSFIILNDVATDDQSNVGLAMTVDNFDITTRQGDTGRGDPYSWIEHRSTTMGKIYLQHFANITIPSGYDYTFGGRYIVAFVNTISKFML